LDGIRAEAVMILDHSGSMYEGYQGGMVQTLVDRALGFALQIDVDGKIPVIPFDSRLWPTVDVSLENYFGVVDREIFKPNHMGGTTLAPALEVVLQMAKETTSPIFLIIVTDDSPGDRDRVTALLKELKLYPVFVKVLSLIDAHYWNKMDDLVVRGRVDNIDAKQVLDPIGINDLPFADLMTDEWSSWIAEAKSAGILV
jgi:hypothetical protein